jgi:glyoxylase-like metal-dependent hydrolase (beta-lactamase superfamily II)
MATFLSSETVRRKALETPGHTPESISILVYVLDASDAQPHAILTGDTLFIADVRRADLRGVDQQVERALHKIEARSVGCHLCR